VLNALIEKNGADAINELLNGWKPEDGVPDAVKKQAEVEWSTFDPQADALAFVSSYIKGLAPESASEEDKQAAVDCVLGQLIRQLPEEAVNKLLNEWKPEDGVPDPVKIPTTECLQKFTGMGKVGM